MKGYRTDGIGTAYSEETYYCPFSMQQFQCPYNYRYREEIKRYERQQQGPPKTPPPNFTPQLSDVPEASLMAVDSGAIAPCTFRFSYIWLKNGQSFWAYLVYVGKTSVSGWRYRGGNWVYFGIDLKEIKSFTCY